MNTTRLVDIAGIITSGSRSWASYYSDGGALFLRMTMLAAATVFISNNQQQSHYILLCFLIPVLGFWILDSYYLWQERIFREIYNDIRKKEKTDFKMNVNDQRSKPKCKWYNTFFSVTLITFYIIEAVFIVSVFLVFEGGIL